jgi:RNA polymerase subunit RPABC4/transcription elongation factor Spt4
MIEGSGCRPVCSVYENSGSISDWIYCIDVDKSVIIRKLDISTGLYLMAIQR